MLTNVHKKYDSQFYICCREYIIISCIHTDEDVSCRKYIFHLNASGLSDGIYNIWVYPTWSLYVGRVRHFQGVKLIFFLFTLMGLAGDAASVNKMPLARSKIFLGQIMEKV